MIDNTLIAAIALNVKANVPLFSNVGGVSRIAQTDSNGTINRFPVCPIIQNGCERDLEKDMSPDDAHTGILFFTVLTSASQPMERGIESNDILVRLTAWYNAKCIEAHNPYKVKAETLQAIPTLIRKEQLPDHLNTVRITTVGEVVNTADIWNNYTFSETRTQYLTPPFYYFAFDFRIQYVSNFFCIGEHIPNVAQYLGLDERIIQADTLQEIFENADEVLGFNPQTGQFEQ